MKIFVFIPSFCAFICCITALNPRRNEFREEQTTGLNKFSQSEIQEGDSTSAFPDSDSVRLQSSPRIESSKLKENHLAQQMDRERNPQLQSQINFAKNILYGRQKRDTTDNYRESETSDTPKRDNKASNRNCRVTESTRSS